MVIASMLLTMASPTPLPVWVTNPPDRDFWTFFWVVIAGVGAIVAVIVGVVAASAAVKDLRITLGTLARRSSLPNFRVTVYVPTNCEVWRIVSNFTSSKGGPHDIDGEQFNAAEIEAGTIYADDKRWIGNVEIWAAPGRLPIRWVIKSEDARVPEKGLSRVVEFDIAAPPEAGA